MSILTAIRHPIRAWQARQRRRAMELFQRYHAASFNHLTGGWSGGMRNNNLLISASSQIVRERTRDLVRNFPPFARAVDAYAAFVVGRGSRFQSLALTPDGEADKKTRQKIESRFRAWMDEADVAKKLHFYELQQLACRQFLENGEWLGRMVTPRARGRHLLAVQMHDAEDLSSWKAADMGQGASIMDGVEFDPVTAEALAYHFQRVPEMGGQYETWREEACNVLHCFKVLRPGQLRGISPFAAAILLAKDMQDYMSAELGSAKMAARWLGIVTSEDVDTAQMARLGGGMGGIAGGSDANRLEEIPVAMMEYLKTGEDVKFAPPSARPGDSFDRFTSFCLRMVSILVSIRYEVLSGDYKELNYSVSKASRNDDTQLLIPHRFRLEQHFIRPVFYRWLDCEALTQDYLPGYFAEPWRYRQAMFIPAGSPSVDPLRDGKADIDAINSKLKSPQQVIMSNGDDPEEVLEQHRQWLELCEEKGVDPASITSINTNLASNPAKLGAEEFSDE